MTWEQVYNPMYSPYLSLMIAATPIVFMFVLLTVIRVKGYIAGVLTFVFSFLVALWWGMPLEQTALAGLYGFLYGLFPIIYIIFAAFFLYNLVVESGHFVKMRQTLENLTPDS